MAIFSDCAAEIWRWKTFPSSGFLTKAGVSTGDLPIFIVRKNLQYSPLTTVGDADNLYRDNRFPSDGESPAAGTEGPGKEQTLLPLTGCRPGRRPPHCC